MTMIMTKVMMVIMMMIKPVMARPFPIPFWFFPGSTLTAASRLPGKKSKAQEPENYDDNQDLGHVDDDGDFGDHGSSHDKDDDVFHPGKTRKAQKPENYDD